MYENKLNLPIVKGLKERVLTLFAFDCIEASVQVLSTNTEYLHEQQSLEEHAMYVFTELSNGKHETNRFLFIADKFTISKNIANET